jgi:ankyrin repeat protein
VDARDGKSGKSALHVSAEASRADEVRALLAAGADPASQW